MSVKLTRAPSKRRTHDSCLSSLPLCPLRSIHPFGFGRSFILYSERDLKDVREWGDIEMMMPSEMSERGGLGGHKERQNELIGTRLIIIMHDVLVRLLSSLSLSDRVEKMRSCVKQLNPIKVWIYCALNRRIQFHAQFYATKYTNRESEWIKQKCSGACARIDADHRHGKAKRTHPQLWEQSISLALFINGYLFRL